MSQPALLPYLLALADDELILGHRNSEWCGHAPLLEEDIAFANLAQDEIGHAALWYRLVETLTGHSPDHLIFYRDPAHYRCAQFVEWPKGDWAFSMLRQFLFDALEAVRLPLLAASAYAPLAETAAKIRTEEIYHLRHTAAWVKRLGLGTEESHRRMQSALAALWPLSPQLLAPHPLRPALVASGDLPDPAAVASAWHALVLPALTEANLTAPTLPAAPPPGRDIHTPHLTDILTEMQSVARLEPEGVQW